MAHLQRDLRGVVQATEGGARVLDEEDVLGSGGLGGKNTMREGPEACPTRASLHRQNGARVDVHRGHSAPRAISAAHAAMLTSAGPMHKAFPARIRYDCSFLPAMQSESLGEAVARSQLAVQQVAGNGRQYGMSARRAEPAGQSSAGAGSVGHQRTSCRCRRRTGSLAL